MHEISDGPFKDWWQHQPVSYQTYIIKNLKRAYKSRVKLTLLKKTHNSLYKRYFQQNLFIRFGWHVPYLAICMFLLLTLGF